MKLHFSNRRGILYSLPVKYCSLNQIELAWAGLKAYIRENNIYFRLSDVERLASEWMATLDSSTAQNDSSHAQQHEIFKQTGAYAEEVEEQLLDDDDEEASLSDDDTDDKTDE